MIASAVVVVLCSNVDPCGCECRDDRGSKNSVEFDFQTELPCACRDSVGCRGEDARSVDGSAKACSFCSTSCAAARGATVRVDESATPCDVIPRESGFTESECFVLPCVDFDLTLSRHCFYLLFVAFGSVPNR